LKRNDYRQLLHTAIKSKAQRSSIPLATAAARGRRATINEGFFMSIPFSILDTLKWMS
jgi:hypothetical protein